MNNNFIDLTPERLAELIEQKLVLERGVSAESASREQFYKASAMVVKDILAQRRQGSNSNAYAAGKKQVHYLSMEFLMGPGLKNNIYNLGLEAVFEKAMASFDLRAESIYQCEPDPGLGNGGLGRLAACYLDGLASTGRIGTGYCILYEYGIFKQKIEDGWQRELPDYWLPGGDVWLEAVPDLSVEVRFGGHITESWDGGIHMVKHEDYDTVVAIPYNMYVSGYNSGTVSLLRLWKANSPSINMEAFNKGDYKNAFVQSSYAESISKVLYPNDNHTEGKLLRLRQQYFLTCASITDIFRWHMSCYGTVENFAEKNAIHINDTHPTLAIPELMRVLLDECGYTWEKAWKIVKATFAYTNHTVMSEALEQWDTSLIQTLLPRIYNIICEINRRFCLELDIQYNVPQHLIDQMSIVKDGKVKMAHLCIAGSHSINGVSKLHSGIIKEDLFANFARVYPDMFTNVTNGIAMRRWLLQSNPLLTELIKSKIGENFLAHPQELKKLEKYAHDSAFLSELAEVKLKNKQRMANYLQQERGITVDPSSLFDVQVKRLHEYKRQHLNLLHIIHQYLTLKNSPNMEFTPKTYFFGAKAAPGYYMAKKIIKLICDFGKLLSEDKTVSDKLKVVFLEEYNVSLSEKLMPASEISEQISLAGTEASGTGNMKLMLSGALTLGTVDGANVEIGEAVGKDNIFYFGMSTDEVNELRARGYRPSEFIDENLANVLNFIKTNEELSAFNDVIAMLENTDFYMACADFADYARVQDRANRLYREDNRHWQRMSLINIASSGIFSADRAIDEYAQNIWHTD